MSVTINGTSGVTTPGISNSEGYSGEGLTIAAGAPSNALAINLNGNVGIGTSSPLGLLQVQGQIRSNTTSSSAIIGLRTSLNDTAYTLVGDNLSTGLSEIYSFVNPMRLRSPDYIVFQTGGSTERMRIDSSGNMLIGTNTTPSGTNRLGIVFEASVPNGMTLRHPGTGVTATPGLINFQNAAGGQVGYVACNNTGTVYSTTSDYRLKRVVSPIVSALDKVKALKPIVFEWVSNGSVDRGFLAHELQEVIPQAVLGEKDAVDDEGNIKAQGVDYGKITPELVAAIQELAARIEILEAK